MSNKLDVSKREAAIIQYLRGAEKGASAREIYEAVTEVLADTISRPAYYKMLDRLVVAGKIDQMDDEGGIRRYMVLPQLHASNRLTLDDVYEMLPFVDNTESLARAIEAHEYLFEHRNTVLRAAAAALSSEPAVNLFFMWISFLLQDLEANLDSFHAVEEEGPFRGQAVLADESLERRLRTQCDDLRDILYRYLSISRQAVNIPEWDGPKGLKRTARFEVDYSRLQDELSRRVVGIGEAETVLGLVSVDQPTLEAAARDMIISGSDGSFHAGSVGIRTAHGYVEDESFVVTFNNSVAYVRSSERAARQRGGEAKYLYSAPVTRQVLNDPTYKGMVLAPFMFPSLTESEYEHMTRSASDVVQMRVDDDVFNGRAKDVLTGEQILPPRVHIRDGTITPQERGFNHYIKMEADGEIAREGLRCSRSILQRIMNAQRSPQIYAGCVKSTQVRLFSRLINWYISHGSRLSRGQPIEPDWDLAKAGLISDVDVMSIMLSNEDFKPQPGRFWVSCVVVRQFASLTDFYDRHLAGGTWYEYLLELRANAITAHEKFGGALPYHGMLGEDDLAEDDYLFLLEHADYASFYIGHTWGNPPPKIPRYEFLASMRSFSPTEIRDHVSKTVGQLATALLTCQFAQDRDHNFLSGLRLVKIIPSVVYFAHELAKQFGKKLEQDFRSAVIARIAEKRQQPLEDRDVDMRPMNALQYLKRFAAARKALPPGDANAPDR